MLDNMNGDPIKQALKDFVATSNSGKYKTEDELMSKFPELSGYDRQLLKDFVATSNSGKYKTEDELMSKFPEFSSPVQKKKSLGTVGGGDGILGAAKKAAEARVASPSSPQPKPSGTSVKSVATGLGSALPSPLKSGLESVKEIPDSFGGADVGYIEPPNIERVKTRTEFAARESQARTALYDIQSGKTPSYVDASTLLELSNKGVFDDENVNDFQRKVQERQKLAIPKIEKIKADYIDNAQYKIAEKLKQDPEYVSFNSALQSDIDAYAKSLVGKATAEIEQYAATAKSQSELDAIYKQKSAEVDAAIKQYTDQKLSETSAQYKVFQERAIKQLDKDIAFEASKVMESIMPGTDLIEKTGLKSKLDEIVNDPNFEILPFDRKSDLLKSMYVTMGNNLAKQGLGSTQNLLALKEQLDMNYLGKFYVNPDNSISAFALKQYADQQIPEIDSKISELSKLYKSQQEAGNMAGGYYDNPETGERMPTGEAIVKFKDAKDNLEKIKELPDDEQSGAFSEFMQGFMSTSAAEKTPFLASLLKVGKLGSLYNSATALKPTEADNALLTTEAMLQSYAEQTKDQRSIWYNAGVSTAESVPFMGEFMLTMGVGRSTVKGLEKLAEKKIKDYAESSARKYLLKPFFETVGTLAQTSSNPQQIAANTIERMVPEMQIAMSDEGDNIVAEIDRNTGEGFDEAFLKGFGKTWTEFFVERAGAALPFYTKGLSSKILPKSPDFVKRAFISFYMRKTGSNIGQAYTKLKNVGWDGLLAEFGEELAVMPMENFITGDYKDPKAGPYSSILNGIIDPKTGDVDVENLKTIAISVSAMTLPMVGGGMVVNALPAAKTQVGLFDINGNEYRVEIRNDIFKNIFGLYRKDPMLLDKWMSESLPKLELGMDETFVVNKLVHALKNKSAQDKMPGTTISDADQKLIDEVEKALAKEQVVEDDKPNADEPAAEVVPTVASPVMEEIVAPPVVEETTVDNGGGIPPVVSPSQTVVGETTVEKPNQGSIINENAVISNTTLNGLTEIENTIGGENEMRTFDTDPRTSLDFTYVNWEGEKTTDLKHYRTSGAKYRVFEGKNKKQYIQVAMSGSDVSGREGGASVIFELTGNITPEMEQAIFELKSSDYKETNNVINRDGLSKFKNDVIEILKGKKEAGEKLSVARPVSTSPAETVVGEATIPKGSPLADVEATAKALDGVARDENDDLTQAFLNADRKAWGKRTEVSDEDLYNKEQSSLIRQLAYDYHKAKADGSNPELVKAVEELLGEATIPKGSPLADVEATAKALEGVEKNVVSKIAEKIKGVFYTGRGKKYEDLTKTKGDFIFFSEDKEKASWYGGDETNVSEAFIDDSEYLDLTSQDKKTKFVDENFTDEDILKLYDKEINFEIERDIFGTVTKQKLIEKYKNRVRENRFSGSNKEQKFLLQKAKDLGIKGIKLLDAFFGESDISTIVIDKSTIKNLNPQSISEAYHKAKTDGSNPELVKAVEELLGKPSESARKSENLAVSEALKDVESTAKALEVVDVPVSFTESKPKPIDESSIAESNKWINNLFDLKDGTKIKDTNGNIYQISNGTLRKLKLNENGEVVDSEVVYRDSRRSKNPYSNPDFFNSGYFIIDNNSNKISEAYHKAKTDGSNPELVKAVEELLGEATVAEPVSKPVEETSTPPATEAAPKVASPTRETKLQKRVREARERIQAKKTAAEKKSELETIRAERAESRAKKEQVAELRTRTPKNVTEGVLRYFADGGKIGEEAFRKEVMDNDAEVKNRKGRIIANAKDISDNPNTNFNDLDAISMRIAEDMQVPSEIYDQTVEEIKTELIDMALTMQSRNDAEASLTESYERELMQAEMSEADFAEYEAEQKFLRGEAGLAEYYSEAELTDMAQQAEVARKKFEAEEFGVKPTQRDAILEKRNEIKVRIAAKTRGRLNAIPVDLLGDYAELAMTYVQEGFLNVNEFINKFKADNADILPDGVTDEDLSILHNEAMIESGKATVASPVKTEIDEIADEAVPKQGEEREKKVVKRVIEGKSKDLEMLEELASDVTYTSENWADARTKAAKLTAAYKKVYGNDWRKAMYDDIVNGKYTVRDNSAVETFLFDELISASEGTEKAFYVLKFSEKLQGYGRKVSAAYSVYLKSEEGLYQFQLSQAADPFKSRLERNKGKAQDDVNEANKKLKKAKKEAIDSAAQAVSETLFGERVASPKQRKERGKAKVQSAKNKMRSIIMNSSSSFDVMNEWKKGGDFAKSLSEMAEGYVDIGIADAQTLIQKIKDELSELGISGDSFDQIRDEFLAGFNLEARVQERLRVEGADKLARKLANRVKERKTGRDIDPLQLLVDTLFRKAEETMPKRDKKGVRLTAEDKIRMAIEDYAAYKEVWDNSKYEFEQIVSQLPISEDAKADMLEKAKNYMESEIGVPYSEKIAEQAVKDEMKSREMELKEILLTANEIQAQTKEDFVNQLTERLVANGSLTPESAKKIAEKFEQKFSELMDNEAQSLLNKIFVQRFKSPKRKKTENQRIIEAVKYGVFDGKTVEQKDENGNTVKRDATSLFADKFGFPDVFSPEIKDQIKTWVEKMVKLPEGSIQRRNVEQQFQNYMAFIQNDNNIFRTLLGMQNGNILFSPGTWINVIRGNMFRSMSELMTIATRKVIFEPSRLKDMKILVNQLGSGVGFREAKGTIAYGQVRRGIEDARPIFAEIRNKYAKNPISRAYWKTQMLSGRIINMLDALFTEPITDVRYADLVLDAINKRNDKLDKSERMTQSEIRELASFILGNRESVLAQADRMAVEEFEKIYGENFPMNGRIGNEFQKRVEELSREIGQQEGERMIGEAFEMYESDFQELFEEARRVSGEIGMVGNPPGTVGLATALIKTLTGMTMPTEWFARFMGAIAYSAKFTFDASPLGFITILKNAASKERGLGRNNKFVENLYKQNSVRTDYYGYNGNLEKREALVRWVGFQMVSASLIYATLGEYIMSAIKGDDDDEKNLAGKSLRDKFFGSDLNGDYWKSRPFFVTGRLFGTKGKNYSKTIEFSKATGVKPYTVYMWGKDMGTYLSDPTLMATFGFAGVMTDAIMFNDKLEEGDVGVVAQASLDQFYIITQSSPFKNISEVINMAMSKKEFSEVDKTSSQKMMLFAMKKLSDEARNTFIPRIFLTVENNTEAILGQAERNNVEWYQFVTKDWPLINNINGAEMKFDHFGDPIEKETTLRSPFLLKLVDFRNGVPYSPFLTKVEGGQNAELYQLFYSKNSVAHRFADKRKVQVYDSGGKPVEYEMTPTEFAEFNKQVGQGLKDWINNGIAPNRTGVKDWLKTLPGNNVGSRKESYLIDAVSDEAEKKAKYIKSMGGSGGKGDVTFDAVVSKKKDELQKAVFAKMFRNYRLRSMN